MKRLFVWVMLAIIQAPTVFATSPSAASGPAQPSRDPSPPSPLSIDADVFRGLGKDREHLTPELIASRSERLEAGTNFYLLRFPQAASAPSRIFDPEIWKSIQSAAELYNLDPLVLAGMIFIESFGDPLAKSPTGPAGIAQLTKASAKEMGLVVGKKIRTGSREVTKTKVVGKGKKRRTVVETRQVPVYKTVDQRYEPELAIMAMARRVNNRRAWLGGKLDFAIAEYHMGAGRMAKLLSAYFGRKISARNVPAVMAASGLTYPELFWTNTPYFRPAVYKQIEQLSRVDFSPTYYFRVRQAMRLLDLHRKSPIEYATLASSYQGRIGQTVASNLQWSFVSAGQLERTGLRRVKDVQAEMGERIVTLPAIASQRGVRVGRNVTAPMAAERSTIGCLLFVAQQLERLQGKTYKGFETGSMVRPMDNDSTRTDAMLPMHTLGWAFDLTRKPLTKDAVRDLSFILTDLRFAGLLAFAEEGKPKDFHVVRHPDHAGRFEQLYWDAVAVPQASSANVPAVQ
jgi:hypothetical protein